MDNQSLMTYNGEEAIVVYQSEDNTLRLDVHMAQETVWLSQQQMAELFNSTIPNISIHIRNIFKEGELDKGATVKDFLIVQNEGGRKVTRHVAYYNLDVIISVGYRVKSKRGVLFRQWATKVLREYLFRGYAFNQRFERIEHRLANMEERQSQFEMEIQTSLPPREGIFVDGQIYDAFDFVKGLISGAKKSIILIDNYADESVLTMMTDKQAGVSVNIYTFAVSKALQQATDNFNKQYGDLTMHAVKSIHDRFLIIDDKEIYLIGASLKDLGRKLFAFSKMEPQQIVVLKNYLATIKQSNF